MENSITNRRPELVPEWSSRNLPMTPDTVSFGSKRSYWWLGSCGHEWQASAKARSSGEKCPICSNTRIIPGINDLKTMYPALAAEWSPRNEPIEPTQVGPGTHKKYYWLGKCGHEWEAEVRNRVAGSGCPYCSHNMVLPGFNDLQSLRPNLAEEWSDKNLPLLPSQVTAFSNRKVWWRCGKGHEWLSLISTRSYGSKCPYCSDILTLRGFNDFATLYPELSREWSDRNGDLKPEMVNSRSRRNVWWKCGECGYQWKSLVKSRVKGTQCPVCAERAVLKGYNDLATTDHHLLSEWDFEKNGTILPYQVSRHSMKPVWWTCEMRHSWKCSVSARAVEQRSCRVCENIFLRTLPQLLIMIYCSQYGFQVEFNEDNRIGIQLDTYIPDLNLAFIISEQKQKSEQARCMIAKHLCEKRGIILICLSSGIEPDKCCIEIKKAFRSVNIFINSDDESDILTARGKFTEMKNRTVKHNAL